MDTDGRSQLYWTKNVGSLALWCRPERIAFVVKVEEIPLPGRGSRL